MLALCNFVPLYCSSFGTPTRLDCAINPMAGKFEVHQALACSICGVFYQYTYIEMGIMGFPRFLVLINFATMVFTWPYNSTGGSLLLVILFHAFFNWLAVFSAAGQTWTAS